MDVELTDTEAEQIAFEFLMTDLNIAAEEQDWFSVLNSRLLGETWYVVEIGIEGLPDKWVLQVYDTKECDPSYTFTSPIKSEHADTGLDDMPENIAEIVLTERKNS